MVYGRFHDRFPRISLELPGSDGSLEVEFVIDTGFDGGVTLPANLIRQLDTTPFAPQEHLLADGSIVRSRVYRVVVEWLDEEREVEVLLIETNPLLGTLLLDGCHIDIEAAEGGEVVIEPLN